MAKILKSRRHLFNQPATYIVLVVGAVLMNFFLQLHMMGQLRQMQHMPVMVQLASGQSLAAIPISSVQDILPATVKSFTEEMMLTLFNWSNKLQQPDGRTLADPGIPITTESGERRLPTTVWQASFALESGFADAFRQELAALIPPEVLDGTAQSVLLASYVGEPKREKQGWAVRFVGEIKLFDSQMHEKNSIPLARLIHIRAIPIAIAPLGETPKQQAVYQARLKGLHIVSMQKIDNKDV